MSFGPRDYLQHILAEADFLIEESRRMDAESFSRNEMARRAFVRSLEIIGEATKKIPAGFRESHPWVEWTAMAKTRDRLIHGYFNVDYSLLWDTVQDKVPRLREQIQAILGSLEESRRPI
jgi:uncharacterized protein with HEPN domain